MNMSDAKIFQLTAIATALATCFGSAWASEEADQLIKELIEPDSSVSIGAGSWSKDRHQFGIYDGMRDSGAYGNLDIDFARRDLATGTWLMLTGRDLGLDNRELRGEWLRQGDIGVSIGYSRLTRDNPLTYITGLQGIGTANQTVSGTAGGALAYPQREISLGTTRDLVELGFYKNVSQKFDFRVSFKNEEKNGERHWGMGGQAFFTVEPIDSTTNQWEAILSYAGEKLQLSGGYYGSQYTNHNSFVIATANDIAAGNNNPVPLSLPLDNQAHQLYLDGGYNFTTATRGTFKLSYASATQDETLPTFAGLGGAAQNTPFINAPSSLNGKVITKVMEVGITARPLQKLSLLGNLRYHDIKDETPLAGFIGSNVTGVATGYNTPHSIATTTGKFEGTYRLPDGFSLTGGAEHKQQDRSAPDRGSIWVPFVKTLEETTLQLKLRRSLSETVNGSLAYLHSEREGSDYVIPTLASTVVNPTQTDNASNPLHIADRKRDKWRGMLDWSPTEKLSLQFAFEDAQDRYAFRDRISATNQGTPAGVKSGDANLFSLDASYTFNEKWQASAWYARDVAKVKQMSWNNTAGALNQMVADLKETGDSFGLGVKGEVYRKFRIGANLEWTRSVSEFDQPVTARPAGTSELQDINTTVLRFKFFSEHDLAKNSIVRLDLIHERWRTDDWTWSFSNGSPFTYGTTTDGTTVTAAPRQNATFVGARYIYKFQ
jgi:MtrB/PioB family decaheme-associated outer membrane protein